MKETYIKNLTSIIMPAYNMEEYIADSIETVLLQNDRLWELIVVNDGSTDKTVEIVKQYIEDDSRIRLVSQFNQGVSMARNRGITEAKGEYITFLDADDRLDSLYLEEMKKELNTNQADLSICKFKKINNEIVMIKTPKDIVKFRNNRFIDHLLNVKHSHVNMGVLYKKSIILENNIRFTPNCTVGEDLEFVMKSAILGQAVFVPKYLYYYIFRENSVIHADQSYKNIIDDIEVYDRLIDFVKQHGKSEDIELYLQYFHEKLDDRRNKLKSYLWNDIVKSQHDKAMEVIDKYGKPLKYKSRNIFQALFNSIKLKIINSKDLTLWRWVNRLLG